MAIAEIEAELARLATSIAEAEARCTAISNDLANWMGPDARAVANALLSGTGPAEAAKAGPSEEGLKAERAALRLAIAELGKRAQSCRDSIEAHRELALRQAAEAVAPLVDEILADARNAAETIVGTFAALSAISLATRAGQGAHYPMRRAVERLAGFDALLPARNQFEVPREVAGLLAKLEGKGAALPARLIASIPAP
ncbi:hypothetical protein OKA06_13405 [Novosphingobium sp. MW5]|nr:hypothetical protein [Novosphingobium sp. MW5]